MDVFILIGSFTIVCLMGMPVAYALGIASILAALWVGIPLEAVMLKVSGGMSGFSLLAIPFFILAGAIMAVGGMAERLVNLAKVFVGFIRGGLALVNILASTLFGCISGSSVADTASIGAVMIPQMIKNGYPRLFAVNVTISGSLQPLLIPPSHNAVIYSLAAGGTVSVAHVLRTVGMVMIMIGFSVAFGYMMAIMRVPALATQFFVDISSNKYTFLLYVNVLLLFLGTFMDLAPMLLICTPIFLPVIKTFGIDPVHFGIIMILNLGIGLLTPPVGPTRGVGWAIARVSMEAVSRSILIFYVPMLVVLALVTYVPELSLWLPRLLLK